MTMEVLSLQSERCLNTARVGDKAARLAAALQLGLPVLPGLVIPVGVSADLLAMAARSVTIHGVHAARLDVMESATPDLGALSAAIAVLGDELVVRSSSPLEVDAEYAGAFTSYVGVNAAEVSTAVRGVWASALTDGNVTQRGGLLGAGEPRMAALIQPLVHPIVAGTARSRDDHVVDIVVVSGSPAPLLAGWSRGETAAVSPAGDVSGEAAITVASVPVLREVGQLARRVHAAVGDDLIEWAATDLGVILFQAKRAASPRMAAASAHAEAPVPSEAAGVARLVHAFAGALGEEMVLPCVLPGVGADTAVPSAPPPHRVTRDVAASAWAEARRLSASIRAQVWGVLDRDGAGAADTLSRLRGGSVAEAVDCLAALPPPPAAGVAALLGLLADVAAWLQEAAALAGADHLWALGPGAIGALISGASADTLSGAREARRRALLRWEPLAYTAVVATGRALTGEPASPGRGAGPAVVVRGLPTGVVLIPRMVVVVPNPIPQLAPLLWGASGLVTTGGGVAAHLVEVARSRGVPAVLGCDELELFALLRGGVAANPLVAVDGDGGRVAVDTGADRPPQIKSLTTAATPPATISPRSTTGESRRPADAPA